MDFSPIFIRADAGATFGTGHVMRMIALAQAYRDRGGRVTIACASCLEAIADRVRREGISFERLSDGSPGSVGDMEESLNLARALGASWIILDGYHFGQQYQQACLRAGFRVLAVDDYRHCESWSANALLNQNIYAPELRYRSEVEDCQFLLGTRFVLLRREFRDQAGCPRPSGLEKPGGGSALETGSKGAEHKRIHRLLVTLGGVDLDNATGRLLRSLDSLAEVRLEIRVVAGGGNPHLNELKRVAAASPHSVQIMQNLADMPALYRWADAVISSGGGTCWEWLFYRLPAAVVCLADNQRPVVESLLKRRLALDLGWHADLDPNRAASKLGSWLEKDAAPPNLPSDLAVDGLGAERVAALLDGTNAWLRPACAGDARLWFAWANDPTVRANGFHPEPISWETHRDWFGHHLQSPNSRLWTGFDPYDRPLGYVRLHRRDSQEWEVGVVVAADRRGQGVGRCLVRLALQRFSAEATGRQRDIPMPGTVILARVRPSNPASLSLFRLLGFQPDPARRAPDCCVLTRKLVNCS